MKMFLPAQHEVKGRLLRGRVELITYMVRLKERSINEGYTKLEVVIRKTILQYTNQIIKLINYGKLLPISVSGVLCP